MVAAHALALLLAAQPAAVAAQIGGRVEVEFIVDGSGSMAGLVGGEPKIVSAKEALHAILGALPANLLGVDAGLRVYGAHSPKAKHDCADSALEVPLAGLRRDAISRALGAVHPTGYTPIARSLELAAGDFRERARHVVVLVTDGIESCGGDPCATSARLQAEGKIEKPYVVGFAVSSEERKHLECIGEYADARSPEDLQKLLDGIVKKAVLGSRVEVRATFDGRPVPAARLQIELARAGERPEPVPAEQAVLVPPGDYTVTVRQAVDRRCGPVDAPVKVGEGGVERVVAAFGRGSVKFAIPGGEPHGNDLRLTDLEVWPAGGMAAGKPPMLRGKAIQTAELCAGRYDLRFSHPKLGKAEIAGHEVRAGARETLAVPFGAGE